MHQAPPDQISILTYDEYKTVFAVKDKNIIFVLVQFIRDMMEGPVFLNEPFVHMRAMALSTALYDASWRRFHPYGIRPPELEQHATFAFMLAVEQYSFESSTHQGRQFQRPYTMHKGELHV